MRVYEERYIKVGGHRYAWPFNDGTLEDSMMKKLDDGTTRAVVLVRDDCPQDPFEMWAEGEFQQFNWRYKYATSKPDLEGWHSLFESYPNQIALLIFRNGSYVVDCIYEGDMFTEADSFLYDGYFIVPEHVPEAGREQYAKAAMADYNDFIHGDVFGLILIEVKGEKLMEDESCWGFFGFEYATGEMRRIIEEGTI
jgi:hypothetical protein